MVERKKSSKQEQEFSEVVESKTKIKTYLPNEKIDVSKKLNVFYNPLMKHNRDISLLILKNSLEENSKIALPLAGSGVRGIRILNELNKKFDIYFNDLNPSAVRNIKENLKLNNLECDNVFNQDATTFLLQNKYFDYIDVDPFGSPNYFLDAAIKSLNFKGIIAVTATDTAALCGTYPKAGLRKYWATTKKSPIMHETGLRILIRKIQLIGAQYEKALIPVLSYSKDHYMRVFLKCFNGKKKIDEILKKHKIIDGVGPMWIGELGDIEVINKLNSNLNDNLLNTLSEEYKINKIGFYDIHTICKHEKIKCCIKFDDLISLLKQNGFSASRTHFNQYGIKSDCDLKDIVYILRKLNK